MSGFVVNSGTGNEFSGKLLSLFESQFHVWWTVGAGRTEQETTDCCWWFNEKEKKKTKKSICYSYSQLKLVYSQSSSRRHFAPLTYCGAARSQLMSCWLLITEHREFGVVKLSQIAMWNVTKSASWRGLRCAKKNAAKSTARKCYKLLSKKVNECDEPLKEMRFRADFMLQLSS